MDGVPDAIGNWNLCTILSKGTYNSKSLVLVWKNYKTFEAILIKICRGFKNIEDIHKAKWISETEFLKNCNCANFLAAKVLPKEFEAALAPINNQQFPILCMEYYDTDLRQILSTYETSCGLQEYDVRQILGDVKNAVEFLYLHKITHANLRPENIVRQWIKPETRGPFIYKIIDSSIAKHSAIYCNDDKEYYAPELILNSAESSDVADFWSFGLVAFEIICGVRPFFPNMNVTKWMLLARKKSLDNICAYETFHGDIEFSSEILAENHLSKPFKTSIEKWLRTALAWNPQVRGRVPQLASYLPEYGVPYSTRNLTIFTLLDEIANAREVKIFCVFTLEYFTYNFDELASVAVVKSNLTESTQIHEIDQLLISTKTNREAENEDLLLKHWEMNSSTTFYLFNKKKFIKEDIILNVPKSVKRALNDSKMLTYNFNNFCELYRCGCFFVNSQKELRNAILKAITVHVEYFHEESRQLFWQHDLLRKFIGRLEAKHEAASYLIETGKEYMRGLRIDQKRFKFVGAFNEFFTYFENISYNWKKFDKAWDQLTVRLHSCSKRSSEFSLEECHLLFKKHDFSDIILEVSKAYQYYLHDTREQKVIRMPMSVMPLKRACQDAFKMQTNLLTELRHQPFIIELIDLHVEISKIKVTLQTASENSSKLLDELTQMTQDLTGCMWTTISFLSSRQHLNEIVIFPSEHGGNYHQISSDRELNGITNTQSLIETSDMLRHTSSQLTASLIANKTLLNDLPCLDFSFSNDSV